MKMNLNIDYKKLSEKELQNLIRHNDDNAIDEFLRRVRSGEIKRKTYTFEEFEKMWHERKKAS